VNEDAEDSVKYVMRKRLASLLACVALGNVACSEITPTSVDDALLPGEPVTLEVRLDWGTFASNLEVFGGYGTAQELGTGVLAEDFGGSLDARVLARFGRFPRSVSVPDTTNTTVVDSMLTLVSGRMVAQLDTLASTNDGPVTLALGALDQPWHARTANWTQAVDTVNGQVAWVEAGGGPVVPVTTTVWDPAAGDTVVFELDSAQLAFWGDTTQTDRGARLDAMTPGVRLKMNQVVLRLDMQPSVNPDTVVVLTAARTDLTFVYAPSPPPPEGIRIGGVPAWRTVLDIDMPATLSGPAALCDVAGCPLSLTPDRINYAALLLRGRRVDPAFQPSDSISLDVRPVLLRSALPKAPLGPSLVGLAGRRVGPGVFGDLEGAAIEIPITNYVRALVSDDPDAQLPSTTLVLLSAFEPLSISYASFFGPGSPQGPVLKLILTAGPSVELP
jgi:hypothetical protein